MYRRQLWAAVCFVFALAACGGADARKERYVEKGQAFMAEGHYEKASLEFRNALQIDPDNAGVRFQAGEAAEKLGTLREAMQLYHDAIEDDTRNVKARARLARLYVLAGMPDKATEVLTPGLAVAPQDPDLLAIRGMVHMRKGDDAKAAADGEKAVSLAPSNENAVALLAALYQRSKRTDDAIALVRRGLEAKPRNIDMRLMLSQMMLTVGRQAEAERELQEVIRLAPQRLAYRYQLAQLQIGAKNIAAAEATLRQAVALQPDDVEAKLTLAKMLAAHRSPEAGARELQAMSDRASKDLALRLALADFYLTQGKRPEAETLYREIVAAEPETAGPQSLAARNRLAAGQLRDGHLEEAEKLLTEVLKTNPRDQDALHLRADLALARNKPGDAIADLRTLLRDRPNSLPLRRMLARAHVLNKEPALAEDTLREGLSTSPGQLLAELAALYEQMGRTDDAIRQYEQLVSKHPQSEVAANNLAMMLVTYRKDAPSLERAEALSRAFRDSDNPALLDTYGWVLYKRGKVQEALPPLRKAVAVAPQSAALRYHLAMAELASGSRDSALDNLQQALAGDALFPGRDEAQAALSQLKP